jgi:hypothetical protein
MYCKTLAIVFLITIFYKISIATDILCDADIDCSLNCNNQGHAGGVAIGCTGYYLFPPHCTQVDCYNKCIHMFTINNNNKLQVQGWFNCTCQCSDSVAAFDSTTMVPPGKKTQIYKKIKNENNELCK